MKSSKTSDELVRDGFENICRLNQLQEYQGKRFIINDTEVAIFKIDGEVLALYNICPHQQTALIYDGFIEDGCVICPAHGWMFDLRTGKKPDGGNGLAVYPVEVV
ncbi:MAG TPA: Rieske 2Fe-2S domain-containing protein, partial [Ignavibacteriaceae bacterium]